MSHKYWCDKVDLSLDLIERISLDELENGNYPTLIFISYDLYKELQMTMVPNVRYTSANTPPIPVQSSIMCINTSAGSLNMKPVSGLRNFLLVGRQEDFEVFKELGVDPIFWNDQERVRIDKAFEDLVILEGDNEEV